MQGNVGLAGPRGDGSILEEERIGKSLEKIISELHGRRYENASRGNIYAVSTVLAGTTVVAGNVAPPAAAAATVLTLYNPANSRVELEVLKVILYHISGTPGAGSWAHCLSQSAAITAAENAAPTSS